MQVLVDGVVTDPAEATISVLDLGFVRGVGVFEAIKAYSGHPFTLGPHLDRLARSAAMNGTPLADRSDLEAWLTEAAELGGDAVLRILCTPGSADTPTRTVILVEDLPELPPVFRLGTVPAPWHPGGSEWGLAGAKTLSYGPNMHATESAVARGFDDALLISRDGLVLEGPTSAVGWVTDGVVHFPTLDLGVLASVSRIVVEDLVPKAGLELRTGRYTMEDVAEADEVMILSTVKEVAPVVAIDDHEFAPGPVTADLRARFFDTVEAERSS